MSSGGYRPGAGRPKGSGDKSPKRLGNQNASKKGKGKSKAKKPLPVDPEKEKLREMLALDKKAKHRFYADFLNRVGKGERLTVPEQKRMEQLAVELSEDLTDGEKVQAATESLTSDQYLSRLMNDPLIDKERRDRAAIALLPYQCERKGEKLGKKDEKNERAKSAAGGRFKPSAPPQLKVVNKNE